MQRLHRYRDRVGDRNEVPAFGQTPDTSRAVGAEARGQNDVRRLLRYEDRTFQYGLTIHRHRR